MSSSSFTGGERAPSRTRGRTTDALGPSDSSDSGSDIQGEHSLSTIPEEGSYGAVPADPESDTDASGTGERASAVPGGGRDGADIAPDRVRHLVGSDALDRTGLSIDDPDAVQVDELAAEDPQDEGDDPDEQNPT